MVNTLLTTLITILVCVCILQYLQNVSLKNSLKGKTNYYKVGKHLEDILNTYGSRVFYIGKNNTLSNRSEQNIEYLNEGDLNFIIKKLHTDVDENNDTAVLQKLVEYRKHIKNK